jgi:hypothetical protein
MRGEHQTIYSEAQLQVLLMKINLAREQFPALLERFMTVGLITEIEEDQYEIKNTLYEDLFIIYA